MRNPLSSNLHFTGAVLALNEVFWEATEHLTYVGNFRNILSHPLQIIHFFIKFKHLLCKSLGFFLTLHSELNMAPLKTLTEECSPKICTASSQCSLPLWFLQIIERQFLSNWRTALNRRRFRDHCAAFTTSVLSYGNFTSSWLLYSQLDRDVCPK